MIKFNNVSFSYGKNLILKDFNLTVNKGDIICLSGESGCGKTTVLRLLLGLEKPDNGEIIIDKKLKPSVVFQENRLIPFKTVLENIKVFSAETDVAMQHLTALGIDNAQSLFPEKLSGGMQRRAAIARALSLPFDFLVLDEPFTGLDIDNIKIAAEHILKTVNDRPIIMVSHSAYEAELLGAKIIKI